MLENSMTKNPKGVEDLFCLPFSELSLREFTLDESSSFFLFAIADRSNSSELINVDDNSPFLIKLLRKSLENRFTFEMTEPLQLFVSLISKSAGNVIMYLTYLQYKAKSLNKKKLNIEDFSTIFPNGIPTDDSLMSIWYSQKVKGSETNPNGSDNLLDYQSASISINF